MSVVSANYGKNETKMLDERLLNYHPLKDNIVTPSTTDIDFSESRHILRFIFDERELTNIETRLKTEYNQSILALRKIVKEAYLEKMEDEFSDLKEFSSDLERKISDLGSKKVGKKNYVPEGKGYTFGRKYFYSKDISHQEGRIKDAEDFAEKYFSELISPTPTPIKDGRGLRFILQGRCREEEEENCYSLLAETSKKFELLNENGIVLIKDYISKPQIREYKGRSTEYRAIHTFIRGFDGNIVEIQFRPFEIEHETHNPRSPLYHGHFKDDKYKRIF
jgi:hypothetical protein